MQLPPDVVDHIFSFLQSDYISLRKCSEGHPFLASLAERHLYTHIALQNHPTRNDQKFLPSELLNDFAERPHLLDNVFSLNIELISLPKVEMIRSLEDISLILSNVPKLTSITLRGRGRDTVAWHNLDGTFQATFQNRLRAPSVTEASIEEIVGFPLSAFNRCKSLMHLSLHGRFRNDFDPTLTLMDMMDVPTLESLSIYSFRPLNTIFMWFPLSNLGVLGFHSTKVEDFHWLAKFLDQRQPPCLRLHLSDTCNYLSIKL